MSLIDADALTSELSPEAPSGPDPSYDPDFMEMERASQGTPERQVGDSVLPAEEPDWKEVGARAQSVLERSRDLRASVMLARAKLASNALPGLEAGLALVLAMLRARWADVHPQLDPEDNNDPTERMNIVASLADQGLFCRAVAAAPLTNSRQLGRFSLRDAMVASGEASPAPDQDHAPDPALLDAAFDDTPTEELQATQASLEACSASLEAINSFLMETVGAGSAPDLGALQTALKDVTRLVQSHLARRGYGAAPEADASGSGGGGQQAEGSRLSGDIRSAQDVLLALDKVIRYYESAEISSPVPLLVRCAQRMVSKSFLEISRVMPPDVVRTIEEVGGLRDETS